MLQNIVQMRASLLSFCPRLLMSDHHGKDGKWRRNKEIIRRANGPGRVRSRERVLLYIVTPFFAIWAPPLGASGAKMVPPHPRQAHAKPAPCGVLHSKRITKSIWIFERIVDPPNAPKRLPNLAPKPLKIIENSMQFSVAFLIRFCIEFCLLA